MEQSASVLKICLSGCCLPDAGFYFYFLPYNIYLCLSIEKNSSHGSIVDEVREAGYFSSTPTLFLYPAWLPGQFSHGAIDRSLVSIPEICIGDHPVVRFWFPPDPVLACNSGFCIQCDGSSFFVWAHS